MSHKKFYLVVAMDLNNGIGIHGDLPWRLPNELKHFAELTRHTNDPKKRNAVIMGRKSWESLPLQFRPLPHRYNIVLTNKDDYELPGGVGLAHSLSEAVKQTEEKGCENIFVIGGANVFKEAIEHEDCGGIYLTEILETFDCDVFFPKIDRHQFMRAAESEVLSERGIKYRFVEVVKIGK